MIADIISNKKLHSIVPELFIRDKKRSKKLNIFLACILKSYFAIPKDGRLNTTHYFITKISNRQDLRQIAINHSFDAGFKDFTNLWGRCTAEPYSHLVTDTVFPSDNALRFQNNLMEKV